MFVVRPPRVWDAGAAYVEQLLASLPQAEGPSTEKQEPSTS